MTKLRFILSILIVLLFILLSIWASGVSISLYISVSTLVISLVVPYFVVSMIFPFPVQRKMNSEIFKPAGTGNKQLLEQALIFFKTFKKILISGGVVWTLMGIIALLANLEHADYIGPNLAVALIAPLYIALFLLIIVEPLRASAEKSLES